MLVYQRVFKKKTQISEAPVDAKDRAG